VKWLVKSDLPPGVPKSWTGLNNAIKNEGFPPGRMCGRNRIWTEDEVDEWLLNRPAAKTFLRGRARALVEGARPPGITKPGPSTGAGNTAEEPGPNEAIQLAPPSIPDSAPAAQEDALW
jgi:hypothetical protein